MKNEIKYKTDLDTLAEVSELLDAIGMKDVMFGGQELALNDDFLKVLIKEKKMKHLLGLMTGKSEAECSVDLPTAFEWFRGFFAQYASDLSALAPGSGK
jgi:hypothetical protein